MPKSTYRVRNWREYNKALIGRGSLTLWITEDVLKNWYAVKPKKATRGRPRMYAELAIELCATLRVLFHLALRQCQGWLASVMKLLTCEVKIPSYSQISRREKTLKLTLRHKVKGKIHVVVDGTGLKLYGEGEWKVRQHGWSKHRMWRKLHIGLDVASQEIVMMELTDNHIGENRLLKPLLDQYKAGYSTVGGDKGYDSYQCHEEVGERKAISAIAVQRKAKIRKARWRAGKVLVRDEIVRRIRQVGRKRWKEEVGYHKRSLVENAFYRYKTILGSQLRARCLENQRTEVLIGCNILNRFTQLGMPLSQKVL